MLSRHTFTPAIRAHASLPSTQNSLMGIPYSPTLMRHLQRIRSVASQLTHRTCVPATNTNVARWNSTTKPPSLPSPPLPPTSQHHDLPSFLAYAARTGLSSASTTYVGTHYEYTVLHSLRAYAIDLTRIGGRADSGIDLVGTWHLPSHPYPLRVIVQCKAFRNKLGPNLIRELEGTFAGAPVGWRGEGIIGVLVSPREATKGVRDALTKSRFPLMWILADLEDGAVRQVLWNGRASEVALEGLGVQVKHLMSSGEVKQKIVLTWDGEEVKGLDSNDDGKKP
ncbi:conserved hypothetical protein [Coccidioides posadasii str. Silveira]|uniref:Restriction endonuclease type IV Mrr domain-containing protein n=3 Tax=Coccidioides posadasii TaxID=199306 RepID=E9DFN5_COCPS|nr:conserved hypothetical protein [Coccidioides posadasii str. Silveira]KMM70561.1 hypothetical protein CPAG_06872 [Coccidioides posadasii RMSCC 3488]